MPIRIRFAAVLFVTLSLTACQWRGEIAEYDLERALEARVYQQRGMRMLVDCPEDLQGWKGAVMECVAGGTDGRRYKVIVTVFDSFGEHVEYDYRVEEG